MATSALDQLLTRAEAAKRRVGEIRPAELQRLLVRLGRKRYRDAKSLARFHEVLVFLRAFPPNAVVLRTVERLLGSFANRVANLRRQKADLSLLDEEEFSGIAGTTLCAAFHYDQVCWLVKRFPTSVEIDWEGYDKTEQLAAALPRFLPLLEEDALVEADVPYRRWMGLASSGQQIPPGLKPARNDKFRDGRYGTAEAVPFQSRTGQSLTSQSRTGQSRSGQSRSGQSRGGQGRFGHNQSDSARKSTDNILPWLIAACERLPLSVEERAEIFGALELQIRWELGNSSATRTLAKRPVREVHFHTKPLIKRSEVSLAQELARPPIKLQKVSRREGEEILDLCREATTVRYRELYGTTRGDPAQVVRANVGRGVEIFLWGLPPERRLPLRAYQAGFTLKNGVPVNYIEGISLFEWMEIGFNTFYAYRDGETAWIYAQALRLLHQILGVTCISVYPYQLGQGNDEALQSGAYWFYRKLGFRPMRPELAKLTLSEEMKIAANPSYRTPPRILRRLAQGHVVYELPGSQIGAWDRFQVRNLGFAVQKVMAERFDGNAAAIRQASKQRAARALGVRPGRWPQNESREFENYALVLALIPDLGRWPKDEKEGLVSIIRARERASESQYAYLLGAHSRLRSTLLEIGSSLHQ